MPKKTNKEIISEMEKSLDIYRSACEKLSQENRELVEAEEGTFLHSPTYRQMTEKIRFLDNLVQLMDHDLDIARRKYYDMQETMKQVREDNQKLTSDCEYHPGMTRIPEEMTRELRKVKEENTQLHGKLDQRQLKLSAYEKEISVLREKLSLQETETVSPVNAVHNARNAGRRKNDPAMQKQLARFRKLVQEGCGRAQIMETMGISEATYYRYKRNEQSQICGE